MFVEYKLMTAIGVVCKRTSDLSPFRLWLVVEGEERANRQMNFKEDGANLSLRDQLSISEKRGSRSYSSRVLSSVIQIP